MHKQAAYQFLQQLIDAVFTGAKPEVLSRFYHTDAKDFYADITFSFDNDKIVLCCEVMPGAIW